MEVVEQPAGLVLLHLEAGEAEQLAPVVVRLGDLGAHAQPGLVVRGDQLDLAGAEAEVVEPLEPLEHPEALLLGRDELLAGELVPEGLVLGADAHGQLDRVDVVGQEARGLDVQQLRADAVDGQVDVVRPLPVGEGRVPLDGLGVDQVGGHGAGVRAEERVRQRRVAPEDAVEVQPHEQPDHRVDELLGRVLAARRREQVAVGDRVVEVAGHEDRRQVVRAVDADAQGLDGRQPLGGEVGQQRVLLARQRLDDLLERVERALAGDEADDVARDAALRDVRDDVLGPLLQREVPGQRQQTGRLGGGRTEEEAHAELRRNGGGTASIVPAPCVLEPRRTRRVVMTSVSFGGLRYSKPTVAEGVVTSLGVCGSTVSK